MESGLPATDDDGGKSSSSPYTGRSMSTTQIVIVTVLSLAVIALLMVRQSQAN
jgi:hypothetical protein